MRRSTTVIAISLSFCAYAQRETYVQHNRLADSAEYLVFTGKYDEAVQIYEDLLTRKPWHPGPYIDAIETCLLAHRPEKANRFLSVAVQHGFVPEVFRFDSLLMGHLASEASKPFREKRKEDEQVFAATADPALTKELDAMYERDQRVRKKGSDPAMMHPVDSANFERLIEESASSVESQPWGMCGRFSGITEVRNTQDRHNGSDVPHIHAAIARGDLSPSFLCMFDDYADQEAGRPMRYGALLGYYQPMPEMIFLVDRAQLDRNRASVGWGPIAWFAEELEMDLSTVRFARP